MENNLPPCPCRRAGTNLLRGMAMLGNDKTSVAGRNEIERALKMPDTYVAGLLAKRRFWFTGSIRRVPAARRKGCAAFSGVKNDVTLEVAGAR